MKNHLSPDQEFPACGYGLSGLCCTICLLGPCRISPFDRDTDRGKCGASADRLVAANLLRLIAAETASRLSDLVRLVNLTGAAAPNHYADADDTSEAFENIFEKYGIDRDAARKSGSAAPLAAKIKNLLNLDLSKPELAAFWDRLYPENVFPQFYSGKILPETSLIYSDLSAFRLVLKPDESSENLLQTCLKISLIYMICDELIQDLQILVGTRSFPEIRAAELKAADILAPGLSPGGMVWLNLLDADAPGPARKIESFRGQWQGPLLEISRAAGIFGISRQFYCRWSRSLADAAPPAVVLSTSAAQVVGMLVCGVTTVSHPPLPFFGSRPAMRFFSEDLKPVFGSMYLPSESGDIFSVVQSYNRNRP